MPVATQETFPFEHVITMLSEKLDRIQSGQLTLCAQVKDLTASLPVQRRPLSRWAQQIHIDVVRAKRNGLCPCCQETRIIAVDGTRIPGASEFDHWYARNRSRAEETWICCAPCNANLNNPEFKAAARSVFASYQLALRRVIQSRQGTLQESPAGVA